MTDAGTLLSDAFVGVPPRLKFKKVKPTHEYVVWFLARSGSTYLKELLHSVGLGDPREWLNPRFMAGQARWLGAQDFTQYFARMRSFGTVNGIFGQEITIGFYETYSNEVRLEDHFDFQSPTIVLFRRDILLQAVSLYRASVSGVFHKTSDTVVQTSTPYEANEIKERVKRITMMERLLRNHIATLGIRPKFACYEEVTTVAPKRLVEAVAAHIGVKTPSVEPKSRHVKIGDTLNEEFAATFRKDHGAFLDEIEAGRGWYLDSLADNPLLG